MAADLDSLRWKIYVATGNQPEQVELVLRVIAWHLNDCGFDVAARYLAPCPPPPASEIISADSTDAEHF